MSAPSLVGCNYAGALFSIEPTTGQGSFLSTTGFSGLNALAFYSGQLYSIGLAPPTNAPVLIELDPVTYAGKALKALQSTADFRDLAFSPNGVLFAVTSGGGPTDTELADSVVTIDLNSGSVTSVGNTGKTGIQAIAFAADGTLYAWSRAFGLLTINTGNGVASTVQPTPPSGGPYDIQGLSISTNGTLFGARDSLFTIDRQTGVPTPLGPDSSGYSDLRGIAFLSTPGLGGSASLPWRWVRPITWAWTILVGYILVTPIGPLCIACDLPLSSNSIRALGASAILAAGLGLWNELRKP